MFIPENFQKIINEGLQAIAPLPDLTVSQWSDQFRFLPNSAMEAGKYRSSRTPHVAGIMDCFNDPEVEEISIQGSAQIAKTTILENIIGFVIDINPQPILFMAPTQDVAKIFSKEKLDPMIELSSRLRNKIAKSKSRDSNNTTLYKRFVGGFIKFVGANSPHALRQMSIPIIISDDIDSIEVGSVKEGDPVLRAEKRSQTFEGRRKKIRASTPTIKNRSRIESFFNQGSQEQFFVRCSACNDEFVFSWPNVIWDQEKDIFGKVLIDYPETAKISCSKCGTLFNEAERRELLQSGRWIAKFPERRNHRSFKINELSSTLSNLKSVVSEFIKTRNEPEKLETFYNLVLGEAFERETIVELNPDSLLTRVEDYIDESNPRLIPNEILFIVSTTDVQKDRLEFNVWGVGKGKEIWLINRRVIDGDPLRRDVWNLHDQLIAEKYKREDQVELKIIIKFVDSGYLSQTVYDYVRRRSSERLFAIKGRGTVGIPILGRTYSLVDNGRTKLLTVGTNAAKEQIFNALDLQEAGAKYIHFPRAYCDEEYFEQLTSEVGFKIVSGLIEHTVYKKKKRDIRNEALDLLVYAYAAIEFINPNFEKLEANLKAKAERLKGKTDQPATAIPDQDLNIPEVDLQLQPAQQKRKIKPKRLNPFTNY